MVRRRQRKGVGSVKQREIMEGVVRVVQGGEDLDSSLED